MFLTEYIYLALVKLVKGRTSCPKCKMHLSCLQEDYEDISSIEIVDFSEFLVNLITIVDSNLKVEGDK